MKGILIIGPQGSGKTRRAEEIAAKYAPESVCRTVESQIPFLRKSTEIIICDGHSGELHSLFGFASIAKIGIWYVGDTESESQWIKPLVVITSNSFTREGLEIMGNEFLSRFEIIDLGKEVSV